MERKIGETFEYEGKTFIVKEDNNYSCHGCVFNKRCTLSVKKTAGQCEADCREDNKDVVFLEVQEQPEQPQKINLCEILKYCPEGEQCWSPLLGDVKFHDINQKRNFIVISLESGETWDINADGTITFGDVTSPEVMLYPSREQRDWTKVKYEKRKELPRTWEEYCKNYPRKKGETYVDSDSGICFCLQDSENRDEVEDKNLLPSKQAAEAYLAYMQLHQLRDAWREGWLPDWKDSAQTKYIIDNLAGGFKIGWYTETRRFLAFQDEKRAEEFLECFIDLIRKAGDLI